MSVENIGHIASPERNKSPYRVVVHGSFKEDSWPLVERVRNYFETEGLEVVAPKGSVIGYEAGFAILEGEDGYDTRATELQYLDHVKGLRGNRGFSYFVTDNGYVGRSALVEHSMATAWGIRTYFNEPPTDMPVYIPNGSVRKPDELIDHIRRYDKLPPRVLLPQDQHVARLHDELPKTDQAVGAIMEYTPAKGEPRILLVRTHQWGNRWSIVGQRLKPGNTLIETLFEGIEEETGNTTGANPRLLTSFDQLPDSGYHRPRVLTFTDFVVQMGSERVRLNEEAQEGIWIPAQNALNEFDIEPNARKTIKDYLARKAA